MPSAFHASQLRQELMARNRLFAQKYGLAHKESYGEASVVVYEPAEVGIAHGNFAAEAYRAILERDDWKARFNKVHTTAARSLPKTDRRWRELDSSMSSDALLMNIFCYPGVAESSTVVGMIGLEDAHRPEFGFKARVPLANGRVDRTEVDMKLGPLLVEAKLTESDFQCRDIDIVKSYRDFEVVFAKGLLPKTQAKYAGYQLIRNVLAAYATASSFCVMHDARRPDLRDQWYEVMQAVKPVELRTSCKVLTWQELSAALPEPLQAFLDEKYGISPT